jgi:hypothetical protein
MRRTASGKILHWDYSMTIFLTTTRRNEVVAAVAAKTAAVAAKTAAVAAKTAAVAAKTAAVAAKTAASL